MTTRTITEINEKIRRREAVVVTADEMVELVSTAGVKEATRRVDVVTTGTFGPMCSSGALLNIGHTTPRMKIARAWLNDVPAYSGIAAVDMYLGATELAEGDPANAVPPGRFAYGGGHVIEDLVRGREVELRASAYGTDCYPRQELSTLLRLDDLNDAWLLNPRNAYQNYNVAVNAHAAHPIHTYLGILLPRLGNAGFCSAGQLSPLLKDPLTRTIGIGTRLFLGGAEGYVIFPGSQHDPSVARQPNGVPRGGAATLAVIGDLKQMSPEFLRGVSIAGYGVSLAVGLGVPIPILDEDLARTTGLSDAELLAPVVDYSRDYPHFAGPPLAAVSYAALRSGQIEVAGQRVRTFSLSSLPKARRIAGLLKERIAAGTFLLSEPVAPLPGPESGRGCHRLVFRPVTEPGASRLRHRER